ncbi:MAG: aminotransferase class I/II-fold pyridoxal phosphate-dependent enzyme [Bacteroidota bacterium]
MSLAISKLEITDLNIRNAKKMGIVQLTASDQQLNGRQVTIDGRKKLNFGSCSYLGLEIDERLKQAAIEAILKYGVQFSSSRAYISLGIYEELEGLLGQIFGHPTLVSPSTSSGHLSIIPVLVGPKDLVILDHQVHASVQTAVLQVKAKGVAVEMIRHNNMEYLESRLVELQGEYDKIWYMADGIYSMYGDGAPLLELQRLLNSYDNFHLYIDDAHGMSWMGKHGSGYVLSQIDLHPKMYLITSLNKSYATAGGAMVFPNRESYDLVRNCGGTLMFSGPVPIPSLGAAVASARIHLSDEIYTLQDELHQKIKYFIEQSRKLDLPLIKDELTPIFFMGVGKSELSQKICQRLLRDGLYINTAFFPSVPYNRAGLRMTITRHNQLEDIDLLLESIAMHLDAELEQSDFSRKDIYRNFKMKRETRDSKVPKVRRQTASS